MLKLPVSVLLATLLSRGLGVSLLGVSLESFISFVCVFGWLFGWLTLWCCVARCRRVRACLNWLLSTVTRYYYYYCVFYVTMYHVVVVALVVVLISWGVPTAAVTHNIILGIRYACHRWWMLGDGERRVRRLSALSFFFFFSALIGWCSFFCW